MHTKHTHGFAAIAAVIIIAIAIVAGVAYYGTQRPSDEAMESSEHMDLDESMMQENGMMEEDESSLIMDEDDTMLMKDESTADHADDGMMMEGSDSMMKETSFSGSVIAGTSAPLIDFNTTDYEQALASDKLVVLYFYANWCPVFTEEVANALYPAFNELTRDDVVGFRINYNDNQTDDQEKALAREFGVAYQHTKVFVQNKERVLKSPESWDKDRYFSEIEKAL